MTPAAIILGAAEAMSAGARVDAAPPANLEAREPSCTTERASVDATRPSTCRVDIVVPAFHGLALMTAMRVTETVLWPEPFARPRSFGAHYEEAFTRPPMFDGRQPFMRWDGDPLVVNVVGHGVFGSELYLRARQCHLGWGGALAFAAATSAVWEYAFEGNGVRPSAQDLVYTPLMGFGLGEIRYLIHQTAGAIRSPVARGVVRAAVDPFGTLERAAGTDC